MIVRGLQGRGAGVVIFPEEEGKVAQAQSKARTRSPLPLSPAHLSLEAFVEPLNLEKRSSELELV